MSGANASPIGRSHQKRSGEAMKLRLAFFLVLIAGAIYGQQVPFERILNANKEPQNWLTYGGTLFNQRYSLLSQITTDNVKNLELQWVLQVRAMDGITKFEATPIVVDGIMYVVKPPVPNYEVVALDAATGRIFWTYTYNPGEDRTCCGRNSKGVAIQGDKLYLATIDAHLIAIDTKTGREVWNNKVESPATGTPIDYSFTLMPLVVKDKVILGPAGGEYGVRGYIAAFDAKTGNERWRFHVIPEPGEPGHETWEGDSWIHGGGSIWTPGSYDPELNLTYWGTGNAGPDWNGDPRPGDNLYTCSVVALDADTGKVRWHYQFSPHDEFDYDSTQVPVLADIEWQGRPRKVMMWANRNGVFYVLDRATGEFLLGKPFVKVTYKMSQVTDSGVLTTATNLVFAGGREGYFFALDARDGKLLWKSMLGGQVANGPITYAVNGKQYVSTAAGNGLFTFALR